MSHALFITSWPTSLGQGSGTALFIKSLQKAVEAGGRSVELVNPMLDTHDYTQFTLDRFWFNIQFAQQADRVVAEADWILGLDYDGFALPRRSHQPFIASLRAVFADLIDTEPDPFRTLLRAQAYFEGHNARRADWITTPSDYAKGKIVEYYGVDEGKVHAIPNGIDLVEWDTLWATLPEPDRSRRPTVLAVSKLYPRKKIDTLIRAVPPLRQHLPDIDVRIVGGGFEWEALQQLTIDMGATDNVTWLGDINDRRRVVAEFKNCHIFTHPSIQDAFANVCLESMAAARPLVVSDAASMPGLVRAGNSGLIVPPNDPEALAHAIIELLDEEARRDQLGCNGRRFAETMTWENTSTQFLKLL
jgi:glycosyltransferase involved in cell wall biosynthesis